MATKGTFNDLSFLEISQAIHALRKTFRIEINIGNKWAMIIFREGELWHVEPRGFLNATAEEIVCMLNEAPEGVFTLNRIQVLPQLDKSVNTSIEQLIEIMKAREEENGITEKAEIKEYKAVKGSFKDLNFLDLVVAMKTWGKTGRIEISHEAKWAMAVFRDGEVWGIQPRGIQANTQDELMYILCKMTDGNFVFQSMPSIPDFERMLTVTSEEVIQRLVAPIAGQEGEAGAGESPYKVLKMKPGMEAKVRYVPQNVKKVLTAINGKLNIAEVVAACGLDEVQAEAVIKDLLTNEIIDLVDPTQEEEKPTEPKPA
jgi:hypothetical protein